jgi:hypothetical protein
MSDAIIRESKESLKNEERGEVKLVCFARHELRENRVEINWYF